MNKRYVNFTTTNTGKVRAVCECCGGKSKATEPDMDRGGEPSTLHLGLGWAHTPFPADCKHKDGSTGSFFTCPACNSKLAAGQKLKLRNYDA